MRWKSRVSAFGICFVIGLLAAFIVAAILSLRKVNRYREYQRQPARCETNDYFNRPEEVLTALKSGEVKVRRDMFARLLLRPGFKSIYYDYERDVNYPERADRARLEYVQLDESPDTEALITFVRFEHPMAMVFKRDLCGWQLVGALSSWLRFEEYPYSNWLTLPETIKSGIHELLVRDSGGDSSSYVRKVRLLRLERDTLTQIAEFEEEAIDPLAEYSGSDWSDVKRRRLTQYTFAHESSPLIQMETTSEVIRFSGPPESYSYWLETDGSWHAQKRNWSTRPVVRLRLLGKTKEQLVWNAQEGRFVK